MSRNFPPNCAISFSFCLHLIIHTWTTNIRCDRYCNNFLKVEMELNEGVGWRPRHVITLLTVTHCTRRCTCTDHGHRWMARRGGLQQAASCPSPPMGATVPAAHERRRRDAAGEAPCPVPSTEPGEGEPGWNRPWPRHILPPSHLVCSAPCCLCLLALAPFAC